MNELTNGRVGEWVNDWINEWMSEWVSEWMNERMDEWMHEWMNDVRLHKWDTGYQQLNWQITNKLNETQWSNHVIY